jgi:hypothetical protein
MNQFRIAIAWSSLLALLCANLMWFGVNAQTKDEVVRDSVLVKKVLKAVRSHVLSVTKDRRKPLVVREKRKSRRFIVMGFPETVTRNKNRYTAQIDVDEYDHKIPRLLYIDVKASKGKYRVAKIRIGPNHFREDVKK